MYVLTITRCSSSQLSLCNSFRGKDALIDRLLHEHQQYNLRVVYRLNGRVIGAAMDYVESVDNDGGDGNGNVDGFF